MTIHQRNDEALDLHRKRLEDMVATSFIQPLLNSGSFLPFNNGTVRPIDLMCLLSDVVFNRPGRILEFGSGISSILAGRLVRQMDLKCEIYSVEHDRAWLEHTEHFIKRDGLTSIVNLVHAPLEENEWALDDNKWYDHKSLEAAGLIPITFDMVLIDGPPAWEPGKTRSRYPAFPFVRDKLSQCSVVYLDDANREGEQMIIQQWERNHKVKFQYSKGELAFYSTGQRYNAVLFK